MHAVWYTCSHHEKEPCLWWERCNQSTSGKEGPLLPWLLPFCSAQSNRHLAPLDLDFFSSRFNNYETTNTTFEIQALVVFPLLLGAHHTVNQWDTASPRAGDRTLPAGAVAVVDSQKTVSLQVVKRQQRTSQQAALLSKGSLEKVSDCLWKVTKHGLEAGAVLSPTAPSRAAHTPAPLPPQGLSLAAVQLTWSWGNSAIIPKILLFPLLSFWAPLTTSSRVCAVCSRCPNAHGSFSATRCCQPKNNCDSGCERAPRENCSSAEGLET